MEKLLVVKRLFDEKTAEAVGLGETVIAQETALDEQFPMHTVSADTLSSAIAAIGRTQAELRKTHLKYHLLTTALLTPHQLQQYARLRGYAGGSKEHRPTHGVARSRIINERSRVARRVGQDVSCVSSDA
jgi:hypothetical protein